MPFLQEAHRSSRNQVRKADASWQTKPRKSRALWPELKPLSRASAQRVAKFFRDTKSELKKVVWPSKAGRQDQHHRRARDRRDRSGRDDRCWMPSSVASWA
ncbi:MAG: preprotein translocase subunit SecE [Faecalibacterium prausnitzii]